MKTSRMAGTFVKPNNIKIKQIYGSQSTQALLSYK